MNKISTEISSGAPMASATTPPERRALSEVMHSTKRSGGNYGSLAKSQSQLQPKFYICHKVQSDDTMQRLSLKYSIHIQEIKRVNKLWSDAELSLLENVYIPVNSSQLSTLRTLYPTLNIVQNPSPATNLPRKTSTSAIATDEPMSSIRRSDSSTSTPTMTTITSSYEDYFSKIDRQIQTSKQSLQSFDVDKQRSKTQSNDINSSSLVSNNDNNSNSDESNSSQNGRTTLWNNGRHKGIHHLSDNSVFVNITTTNTREKHVSAALERIRKERDDFDEL